MNQWLVAAVVVGLWNLVYWYIDGQAEYTSDPTAWRWGCFLLLQMLPCCAVVVWSLRA